MALVVAVLASAVPVMLATAVCVIPTTVAVFASEVAVLLATAVWVPPEDWVAAEWATPVWVILGVKVAVGVTAHWQVSVPPFFQAILRSPYRSLTVMCSMIEP